METFFFRTFTTGGLFILIALAMGGPEGGRIGELTMFCAAMPCFAWIVFLAAVHPQRNPCVVFVNDERAVHYTLRYDGWVGELIFFSSAIPRLASLGVWPRFSTFPT